MPDQNAVKAVAVTDEALRVRVSPIVSLKTAWKTTLVCILVGVPSFLALIAEYFAGVNLAAWGYTPTRAAMIQGLSALAVVVLRAYGVRPIVLDPPKDVTIKTDGSV